MDQIARGRLFTRLFALTLAIALVVVGLTTTVFSNAAKADTLPANTPNSAIVVDNITLVKNKTNTSEEIGGNLVYNGQTKVKWTWNATNANAKAGDSFVISLPEVLTLFDVASFDMETSPGNAIGTCYPARGKPSTITCVFDDRLTTANQNGLVNPTGSGWFLASLNNEVGATVNFNANGIVREVTVPGGPITKPPVTWTGWGVAKGTSQVNSKTEQISWWLSASGSNLKAKYGGTIPDTIKIVDTLGEGQIFPEPDSPATLKVGMFVASTQDDPEMARVYLAQTYNWGKYELADPDTFGTYELNLSFSDDRRTMTAEITKLTGEWMLDANYVFSYYTIPTTADGFINPGHVYTNTMEVEGFDGTLFARNAYFQSAGADAELTPGYGTFVVGKLLSGEAANTVPRGTKVRINAHWTLPAGKTAANYPGWTAPANPVVFEVEIGKKTTYYPSALPFPEGTSIRLEEQLDWADPALDADVKWDQPSFQIGNGQATVATATFGIGGGAITDVTTTNEAVFVDRVSVGDYVWFDSNKDGIQDDSEQGIDGVELSISRTDGRPVLNVKGEVLTTTTTVTKDGKKGYYSFDDLPILPNDVFYEVTVKTPKGYTPTTSKAPGSTVENDSENPTARAKVLSNDGDRDPSLDFGFITAVVSVGDFVWFDANGNGIQDAGEEGVKDAVLTLAGPDGGEVTDVNGNKVAPFTTGEDGKYLFRDLPVLEAGQKYTVTVTAPEGYRPTLSKADGSTFENDSENPLAQTGGTGQADLTVGGSHDPTLDFGFVKAGVDIEKYDGDISAWEGVKETDALGRAVNQPEGDRDTVAEAREVGYKNQVLVRFTVTNTGTVDLINVVVSDNTTAGPGITDLICEANGGVAANAAGVVELGNWVFAPGAAFDCTGTMQYLGDDALHSNTGRVEGTPAINGQPLGNPVNDEDQWHAKPKPRVSVGDYVWFDQIKNGIQDPSEEGIDGVELTISRTDGLPVLDVNGAPVAPTTTVTKDGKKGYYSFDDLPVLPNGEFYEVTVTTPAGYVPTLSNAAGSTTADDSDNPKARAIALPNDKDRDPTLDFGFVKSVVSVGDYVWFDKNKNGIQDPGEPGIKGVELKITYKDGTPVKDVNGDPVANVKTDSNGFYEFTNLPPVTGSNTYRVSVVVPPAGYEPTKPGVGNDRGKDSSTGYADSTELPDDGDRDPSLDFGFVKTEIPTVEVPGKGLARTGATVAGIGLGAAVALVGGAALLMLRRREQD